MCNNLVIYYNDSIDSDNWASALAVMRARCNTKNTRVIWILEPRQVLFGPVMTGQQQTRCQELIARHFPQWENPFKVLLGGLLTESQIDELEGLSREDRELLRFAIMPPYGPKEDAILHGRLAAWDQVVCFGGWSKAGSVQILMDEESLDRIQNPVNLHLHHQEELAARSEDELKEFRTIMNEPLKDGQESLRKWYKRCIEKRESEKGNQGMPVEALDFQSLCKDIERAETVTFFGGSSLDILQRFIEKGVANKLQVHLQAGSCDFSANLFPNQFNVALNPDAARYVFQNYSQFGHFAVVASQTGQSVKYSLEALVEVGGTELEKRILGYNCREDPMRIATDEVTIEKDYPGKSCPMPDLTTFLCALCPGYCGSTLSRVTIEDNNGSILFVKGTEGILMYDITDSFVLGREETCAVFNRLSRG